MARTYGLYCYKTIEAINGDRYRIQFHRENYNGSAFEIDKMGVTPFVINLDGRGDELTRPIVKSSLSIQLVDTEQFDYSIFYTASAFEWKVDVARVGATTGQRFVWAGYLTPDSYSQACVKGATISLTARDNLGYLDEVDFDGVTSDYGDHIAMVSDVIQSAIRVAEPNFNIQYKAGTVGDYGLTELFYLCINTRRFEGKTWGEALTMVLRSFGWQLRPAFKEGNVDDPEDIVYSVSLTYEIVDVAYLGDSKSWNAVQTPMFVRNSKQMSILPNWRELAIEQDYGVIDNFFPMPTEKDYTSNSFAVPAIRTYKMLGQDQIYGVIQDVVNPDLWTKPYYQKFDAEINKDLICLNGKKYANGKFSNSLILTNRSFSDSQSENPHLAYRFHNNQSGATVRLAINLFNQLYSLRNKDVNEGTSQSSGTLNADIMLVPKAITQAKAVKCKVKFDIIVNAYDGNTYVCTENGWENYEANAEPKIAFEFDSEFAGSTGSILVNSVLLYVKGITYAKDVESTIRSFKIDAAATPAGILEVRIYAPSYEHYDYQLWSSDLVAVIFDNIKAQFNPDTVQGGQTMRVVNNADANVKQTLPIEFGSCPENAGGALTYAGGIYLPYESRAQVNLFARNANEPTTSPLSLLTAKALMHHHKKTRNVYSGTIIYDRPYFDALLRIDNKTCAINAASYDVLRNQMTGEFIEVEPYIDPAIDLSTDIVNAGGGSTISSGGTSTSTTIVNTGGTTLSTKRIYELSSATTDEAKSQYVMVDALGNQEAKKVLVSDLVAGAGAGNVSSTFVLAANATLAQSLSAKDTSRIYYTIEQ